MIPSASHLGYPAPARACDRRRRPAFHGRRLTLVANDGHIVAHAYAETGEFDSSKGAFREAIVVDPEEVALWTDLGIICMNSNDAKGADEAFRRAISLDGTSTVSGILKFLCYVSFR